MLLTERFRDALNYAVVLHSEQARKSTQVPYIAHLLGVCALVLEDGGDEDEAIAALLHDAVEDQGGYRTLDEIRERFGRSVADIVDGCTDAYTNPKPPWKERKERTLSHLPTASSGVLRVSIADKLYNARSILIGLTRDGEAIWDRFNGGKEGTLWYYRSLLIIFQTRMSSPMLLELAAVLSQIEAIAKQSENS